MIDYDELFKELRAMSGTSGDFYSEYQEVLKLSKSSQYDKAKSEIATLISKITQKSGECKNVYEAHCWRLLAHCSYMTSDISEAIAFISKAIDIYEVLIPDKSDLEDGYRIKGDYLNQNSNFEEAASQFQKQLAVVKKYSKNKKIDNQVFIKIYRNIARALYKQSKKTEAISYLEDALKLSTESMEQNQKYLGLTFLIRGEIDEISNKNNDAFESFKASLDFLGDFATKEELGLIYEKLGRISAFAKRLKQSLEYYKESISNYESAYGLNDFRLIAIYKTAAEQAFIVGKLENAEKFSLQAISLEKKFIGERIETAQEFVFIATVYRDLGEFSQSYEYLEKAINLYKKLDPSRGINNELLLIGTVNHYEGKFDKAIQYYEMVLQILEDSNTDDYEQFVAVYLNLGCTYLKIGELSKAQQNFSTASSIYLTKNIKDGAYDWAILKQKGWLAYEKGEYDEGMTFLLQSESLLELKRGPECCSLEGIVSKQGEIFIKMRKYEKAMELFSRAAELKDDKYREGILIFVNLGYLAAMTGNPDIGIVKIQKGLEILQKKSDENASEIAYTQTRLGQVYLNLDDYNEALNCFMQGLATRLQTFGELHPTLAESYYYVGLVFYMQERYEDANDNLRRALSILRSHFDEKHLWIVEILRLLKLKSEAETAGKN